MIPAMDSAFQGIQQNRQDLARHADRISRRASSDAAGPRSICPQKSPGVCKFRLGFAANLSLMRVADELLGSLLDVLA